MKSPIRKYKKLNIMHICKISFVAVILSLTVSGSAFANNNAPASSNNNGIAHIFHLNTLPNKTVVGSIKNTTGASDIPFFKGKDHFEKKFPGAMEVDCKNKGQFTEVNFIWSGLQLQAFYDLAGEPLATSRFVSLGNLPLFVQLNLKKEYPSYVVTEASEFSDAEDGLSYYVSVTGPKASYLLHVSTSGIISVFKKMKQ